MVPGFVGLADLAVDGLSGDQGGWGLLGSGNALMCTDVSALGRIPAFLPGLTSSNSTGRLYLDANERRGSSVSGRGHGNRSWIKIDQHGNSNILELDKATIMRHCSMPARDLRLLDPLLMKITALWVW
ncbi:hypothetical protein Q3G72_009845 [Acer saccharum]|nr:hypothetical protein Q3G72_009845 [Acer saccharum]